MTAGNPAPPTAPARPTAPGTTPGSTPGRSTHRMLDPAVIQQRLRAQPAVAEWILAVRAELQRTFGEVDTLSQFARTVKAKRPACQQSVKQLRANCSEQLRKKPGPSSKFAEHVLSIVVEPSRRAEVTARFAALYEAAHGEPAPFTPPAAAELTEQRAAAVTAGCSEAQTEVTQPAVADSTGELRELVAELQAKLQASQQREVAALTELAARTLEAHQLRENLAAVNLTAVSRARAPGQRRSPGSAAARLDRTDRVDRAVPGQPGGGLYVPPRPRSADRDETLAGLNKHADARWLNKWKNPALPLETYWLGSLWDDLRRKPSGGGLEDSEVAGLFGEITRELARDGLGAEGRVPRPWTSKGPAWFYGLLGTLATALVIASGFAVSNIVNPPAPPPADNDNILVDLINGTYSVRAIERQHHATTPSPVPAATSWPAPLLGGTGSDQRCR